MKYRMRYEIEEEARAAGEAALKLIEGRWDVAVERHSTYDYRFRLVSESRAVEVLVQNGSFWRCVKIGEIGEIDKQEATK